ncbi:MAG TPA: group III truncated hemoglobin [Caulobacteraceae bacterium]|nr:group III truncated hemoglobin [Caulobacteraceae bacterium]
MPSPEAAERRARYQVHMQEGLGIDETLIERVVHGFYADVRADAVLGPIFAGKISDWGPHLERMCAFWSSVMLMSGRYHGQPMPKHTPLPIDAAHFDRWLELFEAAARRIASPEAAEAFIERAHRIAQSLELGVAMHHGKLLGVGERFRREA